MGLFGNLIDRAYGVSPITAPALASPFSSSSSLEDAIVGDFFGEVPSDVITPEVALRVPEVKRALQAHTSLVAPLKFEVFTQDVKNAVQPFWVSNSGVFSISPYIRMKGIVTDLFLFGEALVGAELDENDLPRDLLHIPRNLWSIGSDGSIDVDEQIPTNYRQRLIYIPLGANGLLTDGIDSIRQARKLELARQARVDSPPAATELHITDVARDEMTAKERAALAKSYADNRAKYAVSVTPSYVQVNERGTTAIDLFEQGMNSLRLQLANHSGVPASFIEGAKEGGGGSTINYTNENSKTSELWVFGSSAYALAIASRLSMDDVVGPDAEVRADITNLGPAPVTVVDPEPSDITE